MTTINPNLIAAGIFLVVGTIASAGAFASGNPEAVATFLVTVLVLHIASIAAALLFLAKSRRWPIVLGAIAAAVLLAIAWYTGFLQLANNPSTAYEITWLWIWATVPFLALALSGLNALYRHFSRRHT